MPDHHTTLDALLDDDDAAQHLAAGIKALQMRSNIVSRTEAAERALGQTAAADEYAAQKNGLLFCAKILQAIQDG